MALSAINGVTRVEQRRSTRHIVPMVLYRDQIDHCHHNTSADPQRIRRANKKVKNYNEIFTAKKLERLLFQVLVPHLSEPGNARYPNLTWIPMSGDPSLTGSPAPDSWCGRASSGPLSTR